LLFWRGVHMVSTARDCHGCWDRRATKCLAIGQGWLLAFAWLGPIDWTLLFVWGAPTKRFFKLPNDLSETHTVSGIAPPHRLYSPAERFELGDVALVARYVRSKLRPQ
jgi:hypothetical protein